MGSVSAADERLSCLHVPADLARAARLGLGLRRVVPEAGDGVAQGGELRDLLLDVAQARVEQLAPVVARGVAGVADVHDLPDLGEHEAGGCHRCC